ncbi:MAG: hypothetical protein HC880_20495, partial [Bacteroidia bacterium]|nr:hypothetical protein [Bacteroidia bacterium]
MPKPITERPKTKKIEIQNLQKNIERKEKELKILNEQQQAIQAFSSLKELRKYLRDQGLVREQKSSKPDQFPFKKFSYEGFEIWIGKNAKNNDMLIQQYAYKEDLWLHAKRCERLARGHQVPGRQ